VALADDLDRIAAVAGAQGRTAWASDLREDPPLRIRIVTGQPWDARADVLVVPVVGDPDFAGPLGEVDRRAGDPATAAGEIGDDIAWAGVGLDPGGQHVEETAGRGCRVVAERDRERNVGVLHLASVANLSVCALFAPSAQTARSI